MKLAIGAICAGLSLAGSAHAAVTFTSTAFDSGTPAGQRIVENFDQPIAAGYTFTARDGAQTENTSIVGYAAAPAGDSSAYAVVPAFSYAYLTSTKDLKSASFYWGSVDSYNYVAFFHNNTPIAVFSGSDVMADPSGNQTSGATNRLFDFSFSDQDVNKIVFASSGNSFEFDNIAVSAVPEPSSWTLMILGIGGIGLALRETKRRCGLRLNGALAA